MRTFEFESVEQSFPVLLQALLEEGQEVSPRGQLTKEITPVSITIKNPKKRVIPSNVRKLNFGFMCAELIWILSGSDSVDFIGHYNSQWKTYSDDGVTLNGAYGKRIFSWNAGIRKVDIVETSENGDTNETNEYRQVVINQFNEAYNQLRNDPDTRQATIVLFDPFKDYRVTKDKPCTNLLRFMIRDGKLNMTTFMRSNDVWFGYPYDVFNFTMLQEIMASLLNIEVGTYTHIADSFHIYEMHFEKALEVISEHQTPLYNNDIVDLKVNVDELQDVFNNIFNIEALTREDASIELSTIVEKLNEIENEYLKSLTAVLALYNFRKHSRTQEDMDILKTFITNEFSSLVSDWKSRV